MYHMIKGIKKVSGFLVTKGIPVPVSNKEIEKFALSPRYFKLLISLGIFSLEISLSSELIAQTALNKFSN